MARLSSWLIRFFLFNLVVLSCQIGYILSQSSSFVRAIPLPGFIYGEFLFTLFIHVCLYLVLSFIQTVLLWGVIQRYSIMSLTNTPSTISYKTIERWQIIIWGLCIYALHMLNAYFFPLSIFSRLFLPELPHYFIVISLSLSLLVLATLVLNTLYLAIKKKPKTMVTFALLILSCANYFSMTPILISHLDLRPNVILIGVDSLPPNAISAQNTPTMHKFVKQSVLFNETISPLARTYPAWTSILTGQYPYHHGARYNLMPPHQVKSATSIAWRLQREGYQTIFATDDRRFNNLGHEFGFQQIIGPKIGVNDILLGTFNDFPLSNLLINLSFAKYLFPYNHMNRASHFSYYPSTFDRALARALNSQNSKAPLFMAVHFTLPHWPYAFATSSPAQVKDEYNITEREVLFSAAVHHVDKQVNQFLITLKKQGYLENSLVVLLSDHGETLYARGSRQTLAQTYQGRGHSQFGDYLKKNTSTTLSRSAGHGSDLLSTDQYHCVLAFKIYKQGQRLTPSRIITQRVALIDIAPTILDFSNINLSNQFDGTSLLSSFFNTEVQIPERAFIMESGMLPNQLLSRDKARILGQQFFTVDKKSGQLEIKKEEVATLDAMKLYAIVYKNWLLALYPEKKRLHDHHPTIKRWGLDR